MNVVRSLLTRSGVPKTFWPKAVNWSIHILNRSPTLIVQNMTPEEAWSGQRPVVGHFRIFGCVAYAHIPNQRRTKLDDKGENASFLVLVINQKLINFTIPSLRKLLLVVMLFLMKKGVGRGLVAMLLSNKYLQTLMELTKRRDSN